MSIELGILSNHLILCRPLLLLSSIFPRIRVFSNELALHIRWQKYWSLSLSLSPSNEHLISFRTDWFDFLAVYPNCLNEEPGSVTLLAMWPWTYSLASSGLSFFILVAPSLSRRLYKISKWVLTGSFPVTVSVLGLRASETLCLLFKSGVSVSSGSPIFKSCWLSKPQVLRAWLRSAGPSAQESDVWLGPFALWGELLCLWLSPSLWSPTWGCAYIMSLPSTLSSLNLLATLCSMRHWIQAPCSGSLQS